MDNHKPSNSPAENVGKGSQTMHRKYKTLLQNGAESLFLNGGCHVFALALHQRFGYPLVCVRDSSSNSVPHAYCRSAEYAVDVRGFCHEKRLLDAKRWNVYPFYAATATPSEMKKHYVYSVPRVGLYENPLFLREARIQAKKQIDAYIKHYDGTLKSLIGPHPFLRETSEEEIDSLFS
jgi:hypothetical protein